MVKISIGQEDVGVDDTGLTFHIVCIFMKKSGQWTSFVSSVYDVDRAMVRTQAMWAGLGLELGFGLSGLKTEHKALGWYEEYMVDAWRLGVDLRVGECV